MCHVRALRVQAAAANKEDADLQAKSKAEIATLVDLKNKLTKAEEQ